MGGSSVSGGRKFRNEGLKATVKHWCEDSGKAEAKYGHIKDWDMSEVTSMNSLFSADGDHVGEEARQFDDDISSWNVDEVEKMSGMFYEAKSFNQDLSGWNVEKCTDMSVMFIGADKFNKYSVMKLDLSGKTTDIIFEFGVNEGERREDEKKRLAVAASGRKFGNDDLRIAVKEWCEDRGKAEVKYRHISGLCFKSARSNSFSSCPSASLFTALCMHFMLTSMIIKKTIKAVRIKKFTLPTNGLISFPFMYANVLDEMKNAGTAKKKETSPILRNHLNFLIILPLTSVP
ncbi:hypothetical protein TL16_g09286 [Triparma laevis f. inornata]|uniref:Uncharacterized protein n=2 Tax=Triparma laevis TaxID=1534972 RepID=A0A9W7AWX5_9STRA|nr:hypothetical protein TrLO_g14919 [Triparma laevis f. longispina]GMH82522.1 hypothetical protein TL16_g09286 [Triparma laevis f. inornata]